MSDLTDDLAAGFGEATDADLAQTAAENVAAFAEAYDEELTSEAVLDRFEDAPYADFQQAFNWLVGDLAADNEDCTDSREFRIDGYDQFAADPTITG
ncbi:hypothetical protein [Haloarcula salinisoli]|uniref:Uncharacterized protein n=1 Tax=Haloarcula salinisoli TaxID=2487746 RepID=A0A8J7YIH2_9EURY|nr:hypothetical protein [Halomicroarcula salinisoli]MBX0286635.1 hypothetical protein [Halomicroarcula salinisoli]MBX0303946.1 hypothetical protein [Halomicroarcula salinisoli]